MTAAPASGGARQPSFPGPPVLGRGAVVTPGQPTPAPLDGAPRLRIDAAALADAGALADRLHRRWAARERYVVELAVDHRALWEPERSTDPVWAHDPAFLFPWERLRFLVWANTYDCRDPQRGPVWWHAVKAARACRDVAVSGPADVLLAGGGPAWIDGGPRQPLVTGDRAVVIHRESTETGRTSPLPPPAPAPDALAAALAPDQLAAVLAPTSCARITAPAGSGKTRVLTERLRHLLDDRGYEPDLVLAVAYNTDAAAELRGRSKAAASTVHAWAYRLLQRHRGRLVVWDETEQRRAVARLVTVERQANADPLQPYLEALERVRVALVDPEEVEAERDDVPDFAATFERYRDRLRAAGAVDFPEMVYAAIELLLADPQVRAAEQARAHHLLVDEFQDLTPAYLLLLRLLAAPQLQCFGVGDEDQVIYGHAGATPEFLLGYDRLFPGAEHHPLEVNYRCPPAVVEAAVRLLGHNRRRTAKTIRPAPGRGEDPAALQVIEAPTPRQAKEAAARVAEWLDDGRGPAEVAVLARINVALLGVQVELALRDIPHHSPVGPWLAERTGVQAALTYLRLACAGPDRFAGDDVAAVLYRPFRPLPGDLRDVLRGQATWSVAALDELGTQRLGGRAARAWAELVGDLDLLAQRAAGQPTSELLRFVRDAIGVGEAAANLDASAGQQIGASHVDDLDALLQIADRCPEPDRFAAFLHDVLGRVAPPGQPAVRLASVHKVKGLQWPCVVIVGAAEGVSPHRLAVGPAALEEERRVFHVALTRASHRVVVVTPQTGASRFVAELRGKATPVPAAGAPRGRRAARSARGRPGFRATPGLAVRAAGGLEGTVEQVGEDGVFVRTSRGSLLRLRYGEPIEVDGQSGRLLRP